MRYVLEVSGRTVTVDVSRLGPARFQCVLDGGPPRVVDAGDIGGVGGVVHLLCGEASHTVRLGARGEDLHVHVDGHDTVVAIDDARHRRQHQASAAAADGRIHVRSPMPGKIVKVLVAPGDAVVAGQGVAIVEAMKMENELRSPGAGVVTDVRVRAGDTVEGNAELVVIESVGG
jgi:biotin carboxyl carrier protein